MRKKEFWRAIFTNGNFKKGEFVKFRYADLRYRKRKDVSSFVLNEWVLRKTYCYGIVSAVLSEGDEYLVKIVKGCSLHGTLHAFRVKAWSPRK